MIIMPKVVCLCGSTRFKDAFEAANARETLAGRIVLSVGVYGHADHVEFTEDQKNRLDRLHLQKIDMSDEILVIDVDRYIGKSTRSEIAYAAMNGKNIRYLSEESVT